MNGLGKKLALAGVVIFGVSACTDPSRLNGTGENENTTAGAIIGGIAGAIAGRSVSGDGDKTKGTIIGAVVGAGAGTLIGQKLDQQAADLRRDLGNDQVQIVNTGTQLVVTMPQDILFAVGSSALRSDLQRDLGAVAGNLMAYPDSRVQVIGHTDNTGDAGYNLGLSRDRAQAVTNVLLSNGVPSYRLQPIGRGEDQPVATNLTPEGRALNRRVELVITPNGA